MAAEGKEGREGREGEVCALALTAGTLGGGHEESSSAPYAAVCSCMPPAWLSSAPPPTPRHTAGTAQWLAGWLCGCGWRRSGR